MPSSYGLYSPRIEDRNVRRLYRLKIDLQEQVGRKLPMTVLVNRILDEFFESQEQRDTRAIRASGGSSTNRQPDA